MESVVDAYYSARPVDDHQDQEENYSSVKEDDKSDQEYKTDLGIEFEFESDYDISERSRVQEKNTVVLTWITRVHAAPWW